MGNPAISINATPVAAPPDTPSPNGILAYVGGDFVAAGARMLPVAGPGQAPERKVPIEVPALGHVQITYRLNWYKHGRSRHWHWRAVHAERV